MAASRNLLCCLPECVWPRTLLRLPLAIALLQFRGRARLPRSCERPEGRPPGFRARPQTREIAERNLQNLDQAFYEFEEASRLVPQNVEYLTAREITRQHLAGLHLERGNSDLLAGRQVEALAEFRTALNLDPQNEFAQQRISDALGPVPVHTAGPPQVVASADALTAKPIDGHHDIHYRGDSRGLLTAVACELRADGGLRRQLPQPPRAIRY